ncbi:MAG: hypothetical protein IKQ35_03860 [Bacilli bacterium]|nr:hypothetical protein [Bacilli bacterium]
MKKINIILLIVILALVVGLILLLKNSKIEEKPTKTKKEEINYIDYTSYDKNFSIRTSKDWKLVDNRKLLNKDANLELYNEKLNAYFLLVVNNKIDYKKNFNNYKAEVFKQKIEQYNIKIKEFKKVNVNNYNWEYIEFNYTNENAINTYIRSYAIETKNYYGQILVWTIASNQNEATNEFDNIISKFKEIE